MAEDEPKQAEDQGEAPSIVVPSHAPLPLPPDVPYTRPTLGRGTPPVAKSGLAASRREEAETGGAEAGAGPAFSKLGAGLAAATTFVASVIAGFLIGQWLDQHWGHPGGTPWGTLVFALLGVAAGFLNLFRVLTATDRKRGK